jgi:hypothetical protein
MARMAYSQRSTPQAACKELGGALAQVEKKVQASTAAAATSGLVLFILGRYVFRGDVPDVVTSWTYVAIPAVITFAAGWATRHTHRPVVPPPRPPKTLIPPPAAPE